MPVVPVKFAQGVGDLTLSGLQLGVLLLGDIMERGDQVYLVFRDVVWISEAWGQAIILIIKDILVRHLHLLVQLIILELIVPFMLKYHQNVQHRRLRVHGQHVAGFEHRDDVLTKQGSVAALGQFELSLFQQLQESVVTLRVTFSLFSSFGGSFSVCCFLRFSFF